MKFRLTTLCLLAFFSTVAAAPITPPIIDAEKWKLEAPSAVAADPANHKIYVGARSRDPQRKGLYVFDTDAAGNITGTPRQYSDHPLPLTVGEWSLVSVITLDLAHHKLFLGISPSHTKTPNPLVMYSLNEQGEPVGVPRAFSDGSPYYSLSAITLHPRLNRLYLGGFGKAGAVVYDTDAQGVPIGEPKTFPVGGVGKQSIAIRADGRKIYLGTYPYTLEVSDLDAKGHLTGTPRTYPIAGGEQLGYLQMTANQHGVYFAAPGGNLGYFSLDATGEPAGTFKTAANTPVQRVAALPDSNNLHVAAAIGFDDAVTGKHIISGTQLRELATDATGAPGATLSESALMHRSSVATLAVAPAPVLVTTTLGYAFLGNRFTGLRARATLLSLQAKGALLPVSTSTAIGKTGYLRFTYSPKYKAVYAAGDNNVYVRPLADAAKVTEVAVPDALPAVAVDDVNSLIYVARKEGIVAIRALDANGVPAATGKNIDTGISPIGALALNPRTRHVYVIGAGAERAAMSAEINTTRLVPLAGGFYTNDAVVDAARGRVYAAGSLNANKNLWIWKLKADGTPDGGATVLADGFPINDARRGALNTLALDEKRRKLYAGANPENAKPGEAYLLAFDLDAAGDVGGAPRTYPSPNNYGSAWSIALSPNGNWMYEGGFGESNVIAHSLNAAGEPSREVVRWPLGGTGKDQLMFAPDASLLLVGSYPSLLETIRVKEDESPLMGAQAAFAIDKENLPLGVLYEGSTTEWMNLDNTLKDAQGWALGRLHLTGGEITKARLKFEVALQQGDGLKPLASVTSELEGGVGALFVPRYGTEDVANLGSYVQDAAGRFRMYRDWAVKYGLKPEERPKQFTIANGLIGLDSNRESLEIGLETLQVTGHNNLQIWNFPGIAPEVIRTAAAAHGIKEFRAAIYNPPSYYDFDQDKMNPAALDKWANEMGTEAAKSMGVAKKDLTLYHIGDEPGWYFPYMNDEVRKSPMRLAAFRDYLKSKGFTPGFFGQATWDALAPLNQSKARSLPERRLYFWTTRFFAEMVSRGFAASTRAMQRQINPKILTGTNLNNWPGRYYIPSPGAKIANNWDTSADAAEGMPDWFDLGRKKAVTCLWTEDWFADRSAQNWSMYGDLLRCAAREGGIEYGAYIVGQSAGQMAEGGKYKIMSLFGHGAKATDYYIFGPLPAFGDGWSDNERTYRTYQGGMRLLGTAERLMFPGRPRHGTVAILLSQASQPWDPNANGRYYIDELYGLYSALLHENYAIDFVDDFSLENGDLAKYGYSTLYITGPNLSTKAQQAVLNWVRAGGTVALAPGAGAADEYNERCNVLWEAAGATRTTVAREDKPRPWDVTYKTPTAIALLDPRLGSSAAGTVFQLAPLAPTTGKPLAKFADGKAAVVASVAGKGRIIAYGYWPGCEYANSPNSDDALRLPVGWDAASRRIVTAPARFAATTKHVDISADLVEGALLESTRGVAVTLLNWSGEPKSEVTVTVRNPGKVTRVSSIEQGALKFEVTPGGLRVKLPLSTVDVLMIDR